MKNLTKHPIRFTQVTAVDITVAGGAAGYVDTDLSATVGTDPNRLWLFGLYSPGFCGVRPHGSALNVHFYATGGGATMSYVDSAGHADLYRNAADTHYYILGYIE